MKRYRLYIYGITFGILAATAVSLFSAHEMRQMYEARASLICGAVAARVQVGAFRDAFDQAYSLAQFSANGRSVPISMRDGAALYGQAPNDPSKFHREECKAEGRPDFLLTLFFDSPPIFGLKWLSYTAFFLFLFFLSILALRIFSSRLVNTILATLSKGIRYSIEGKKSVGFVNGIARGLAEKTPAIRELKTEISRKAELTRENSDFQKKLTALTVASQEKEKERKKVSDIVQQFMHDIGGPMAYLRTFLLLGDNSKEMVEGALISLKKIEKLKEDLSQIEGAEIIVERVRELALVECVMHEVVSAKKVFWRPSVKVEYCFDPVALNISPVDAGRLGRIFDNLLQNSYEAISDEGIIRVAIEKSGDGVVVSISDSGCGVPQHVLARLGSSQVTFGKAHGNGIGLFRAKQWVDAWGGNFSVESKFGCGTTIKISLPVKEVSAKFTADLSRLRLKNVVVVDDDALAAKSLLSKAGGKGMYFSSISQYADWLGANDALDENTATVYDLRLNPGSGLDLLQINPEPEKAILYTNDYLDSEAMALSATLGFCIYPKPFLAL